MRRRAADEAQLTLFDPAPAAAAPPGPAEPAAGDAAAADGGAADAFIPGPLPDAAARERIRTDLETNLLVEAGAGSGKTTALVERMVELVCTGAAPVESIAAVTFTRKAAAELRQRFQTALESATTAARERAPEEAARLDRALQDVDRTFIGTIHSFCARLLRERPLEAGLDPRFRELMGVEEVRLRKAFWRAHLEGLASGDDPVVRRLDDVGLAPSRLRGLFDALVDNPDVDFPAEAVAPPDPGEIAAVRTRLDRLIDRGLALMPAEPAERGWDNLQRRLRLLAFLRRVVDWKDAAAFLDVLGEEVHGRSYTVTKNRWPDGDAARALEREWGDLRDGAAAALLDRWWTHRYPVALEFAGRAAAAFETERRRTARLNFQDLLMLAARLLRENPEVREALGQRYRRLLVDEFQDTDPVQAEVLMLLAAPADGRPWQQARPRPGALFVVGDPKQSIYRFRRADIAVYNLVRDRFTELGAVVELVANFRSLPPVGALVEGVFGGGRFPAAATPYQAAYAPLRTRRVPRPQRQRIAQYMVEPDGTSRAAAAADGAARLVPWIAGEIGAGRREPGDFLILARQRAELATYARALERWRVPVQVTGAGLDRTEELDELLVLLDALADPTNPVRVVAVLVGLLFGLDHDDLIAWSHCEDLPAPEREAVWRTFDITRARPDDATPVGQALARLREWWELSREQPADVLVGRIVDGLGLVPLAASRELGELRAGSLLFALDAIRVAALDGDTSVAAAAEAVRAALESDEVEAPLEPVRRDVTRVMTLHQAKGLEAPVVVLVHPVGAREHDILRHIERRADGSAVGALVVQERDGRRVRTLARPAGWEARVEEERRFDRAEQDRLLYVAATRAGEELLVARKEGDEGKSPWSGLYPWIDQHGETLSLSPLTAPGRERLAAAPESLAAAAASVAAARAERRAASYEIITPTAAAKAGMADPPAMPVLELREGDDGLAGATEYRGLPWGSAVHRALDAAARGARGDRLRRLCRAVLVEAERPLHDGEPEELDELVALVERVLASPVWARAQRADRLLSEAPFAARRPQSTQVVEGVVDLAFREDGGWVVVDYKTDVGTDAGFERRRAAYRRQVELYARVWEEITGEPVRERVLFYTARPAGSELERW